MNKITVMKRIKELDTEMAQVQVDDIDYNTLKNIFAVSQQQSKAMIMYLDKCELEGLSFDEAQFDLEGYMLGEETPEDVV